MRVVPYISLVMICLLLMGCNALGRRPAARNPARPAAPPSLPPRNESLGIRTPPVGGTQPASEAANSLLAGQAVDSFGKRPPPTFIQVVEVGQGASVGAPIEVAADSQGYFVIQGLQPGRSYELRARAHDGDRRLAGTTYATPPNPRVLIHMSEDFVTPHTPPLPPTPNFPGAAPLPEATPPPPAWPSDAPANPPTGAATGPGPGTPGWSPIPGHAPPPSRSDPANGSGAQLRPPISIEPEGPPVDLTKVIAQPNPNGPRPAPASSDPINMTPTPAPSWIPTPGPVADVNPHAAPAPVAVPSCQLVGRQLHNFALYDVNGQPWEFRHRRGRLVLIDFWGTWCIPCLNAVPHLKILQQRYGAAGLEVIGIAYENGTPQQKITKVTRVRDRMNINYRLLIGDRENPCPVKKQFEVQAFPTLVLLDESGRILWRCEGADQRQLQELDWLIRQRLGVR
ncbi:MAG: redoxin family protein [Gemmataceae bacterium]